MIRQQQVVPGTFPARVDLVEGVIDNGMGGSLFSNDGGVLVLDQLTVANVTSAVSIVSERSQMKLALPFQPNYAFLFAHHPDTNNRVLSLLPMEEW